MRGILRRISGSGKWRTRFWDYLTRRQSLFLIREDPNNGRVREFGWVLYGSGVGPQWVSKPKAPLEGWWRTARRVWLKKRCGPLKLKELMLPSEASLRHFRPLSDTRQAHGCGMWGGVVRDDADDSMGPGPGSDSA